MASLTFLGAARTVTGSKYLLEADGRRILVDCGQFQGLADLRRRNWAAFPVDPKSIDAVVLTHAHIDHSGLLPRLVSNGFKGPIFCTHGTSDLCSLVLPDAGHLQEEDARLANRKRFSKHTPALPLFTEADALATLTHLRVVPYATRIEIVPGLHALRDEREVAVASRHRARTSRRRIGAAQRVGHLVQQRPARLRLPHQ